MTASACCYVTDRLDCAFPLQTLEMHHAGWTWHMLNDAFLSHRGFQTSKTHSKDRNKQTAANAKRIKAGQNAQA